MVSLQSTATKSKHNKGRYSMNKKNFIFDCLHGLSDIKDIDSYVEAWHNGTSNVELSSFLGMTQEEYETWVQNGDSALKDILHNRTKSV